MRCRVLLLWTASFALVGCSSAIADGDGRTLGEPLGDFVADGALESSTCGAGALGSPESLTLDLSLSRDAREVYWQRGSQVDIGYLTRDAASFSFETRMVLDIREASRGVPSCVVERRDALVGSFRGRRDAPDGFEASLTYGYTEIGDSDCSDLLGAPGGLAALPCQLRYGLVAERSPGD